MQGLKAEILRGFWYMAIPGASLAPGRMTHLRVLDEPVLVGRGGDGSVFALRDICPHRGVPRHHGSFDGDTISDTLPAIRTEERRGDKHNMVGLTAFRPITDQKTTFHQMFWTTIGWAKPLKPLIRALSRVFLDQDRDSVLPAAGGLA